MPLTIAKKKPRILELIIIILVIFMPMHRMLFDAIIPGSIDNLWRDVLIILSFFLLLGKKRGRMKLGNYGMVIILMWIICLLYTAFSDRVALSLNLTRTYCVPMLIYFILINANLSEEFIKRIEKIFIYVAVILTIFGVFQAFVLGDSFLVSLGYATRDGVHLKSNAFYISGYFGIQRVTSTFTAPNICGVYLGMAVILLSMRMKEIKRSKILLLILAVGLITTFSRSAILGTILGLLLCHRAQLKLIDIPKIIRTVIPLAIIALIGVIIVDRAVLNGLITNMVVHSITITVNGTDSSAAKHLFDLWEPIERILKNPFGLGFGHNGPIVLASDSNANLVESSVYLLAYNFGILGTIVFLYPYIREAWRVFRKRKHNLVSGAICVMALFTYLLLPNIETYEIIFFVYFFMGLSYIEKGSSKGENDAIRVEEN
jgi:hypothetical protein